MAYAAAHGGVAWAGALVAIWGAGSLAGGILLLRFYGDMSQAQIGAQLGMSQMHVSRLQAHALGDLRERLFGFPAQPAATGRASPRRVTASPSCSGVVRGQRRR